MGRLLNNIAKRFDLSFRKGCRFKTIVGLLCNAVLFLKWRILKLLRGIHAPIVHYYAVCWNEEMMLPFMFKHYDSIVDKFFIYDNGSTDSSKKIINSHPHAILIPFQTKGFDDNVHMQIKNECWKKSRGKSDYVIVCDIDEFTYVSNLNEFFSQLKSNHISMPHSQGYDMVAEQFPNYHATPYITSAIDKGVANKDYSKCLLFNPYKIVDINYEPGAHFCHPVGIVRYSKKPLYKVLHYKNLGANYVINRFKEYRSRMSEENIKNNFATQYYEGDDVVTQKFKDLLANAQQII